MNRLGASILVIAEGGGLMAKPKSAEPKANAADPQLPKTLQWLWDAPMFIDEIQVGRFYDAVVRPETKGGKTTISLSNVNTHKASATLGFKAGLSLGDFAAPHEAHQA